MHSGKVKWFVSALLAAAGLVCLGSTAFGQAKVGTTGVNFLELGISARADGMGGAFVAVAADASAMYYNPAGLVQIEGREVVMTWMEYVADISYGYGGVAFPLAIGGVVGFSFHGLSTGDIPKTTYKHPYASGEFFQAKDYAVGVSYSRYLTDRFSLGVTFKWVDELLEESRATGWAADVGTNYNTGYRNFKITMVITNFGPEMKHIQQPFPLPINFHFGTAIDILDNEQHRATFAIEGSHPADNLEKYNAGVEYWYNDMLAVRVGSRFEHDLSGLTWGLGFRTSLGQDRRLSIDYARQSMGVLGDVNRYTFGLMF